ncbi:MAG: inorganic phosphate transporter [Buchnera aphidicola (Pentalonia nigronervosa)]|jgi:low-affinity inorganic phosphate transporter|uniref:Phosphate transporter n=1 Tax=Buchnera aphidicola (Pentalonia nigronervosa) TaxID=1309793 RepID=A0A7H1AZ40_9GAMM|nr:MAG: inorganic phosphate transporter [Buchnera aphidicola (Pentalonia nigronervosa)]
MLDLLSYSNLNHSLFIFFAIIIVLFYETINGFHDTANSVSTLIYTRSISENSAVIISGIFNFLGVIFGGLTVAYTIVHLLPNDILLNIYSKNALAMIFSILLASIIWNLFTWYFCLPASSSHTLIGAIIGTNLTHSIITHTSLIHVFDLSKIKNVFLSLVFSPIIGLIIAGIFIILLHVFFKNKFYQIYMTPLENKKINKQKYPPILIRLILIISSIGVSYAHGANDGQKGIGLIMLILIGLTPSLFSVNIHANKNDIIHTRNTIYDLKKFYLKNNTICVKKNHIQNKIDTSDVNNHINKNLQNIKNIQMLLDNIHDYNSLNTIQRLQLRQFLLCVSNEIEYVITMFELDFKDRMFLNTSKKTILSTIEYAPIWIILIIAASLSIGTMLGWKRIVITIGEKIGKKSMTYAQAMAAQITASISINIASYTGIPVSTTHILSSSLAGSMLVDGNGIQIKTIQNILIAWMLTVPISILLSSILYWILLLFI